MSKLVAEAKSDVVGKCSCVCHRGYLIGHDKPCCAPCIYCKENIVANCAKEHGEACSKKPRMPVVVGNRVENARVSLREALHGKRIVEVKEIVPEKSGQRSVRLFLDDATVVDIGIKGAPSGYEWNDYLAVTVLGTKQEERDIEVFRG